MSEYKIVVTVSKSEADALRVAIGSARGGKVGDYTHCRFLVKATGLFLPVDKPTIREVGQLKEVAEEPAIDIYELVKL